MGVTSIWQASSTTVWSSAGAWSAGVPGSGAVAAFTAGTGDCTIDIAVDVASIVGTAGTKFTVNANVTAGYIDTTRMFKVTTGNKVSVTSANSGGTLWLDPTSTGEVDVNLTGIGNYNVWNNSSNPSAGPLSAFKIAGTTGASYKLCARLNTAAIDASGITARFNLTCGTSGLGKILTVPSGCTVTMPSTPGWLNADHVDSSNGGTVTATGGIDQGSNVKWSGLLPPPVYYTLTYTAGAHGSIVGSTPQTVLSGTDGTTVTATPATHYHFVSWSDGVLTAARTDTNVTGNITVTASFAIDTKTLTYTAGTGGTITGTTPQTVNYGGDGTTVTAIPSTGYLFAAWSDAVPTAARTDTGVTTNISVTASFGALPSIPDLLNPDPAFSYIGASFHYQIVALNTPTHYAASGCPPGLSIHATTGLISGIPTTSGYYPVVVTVTNAVGTATKTIQVQIEIPSALEVT